VQFAATDERYFILLPTLGDCLVAVGRGDADRGDAWSAVAG
jgi:hypothetical protein